MKEINNKYIYGNRLYNQTNPCTWNISASCIPILITANPEW